jgi:hypothetical protein
MAPVAGGVADGEEDGLIFAAGFFESLLAPGIPIDGVQGVLAKIRAFFVLEAIGWHKEKTPVSMETGGEFA